MVKRKATVGDAVNAKPLHKKVSPERLYHKKSHADDSARPADPVHTSRSAHPPPGPDTLICLEVLPHHVEHPREEVLIHNSEVIKRQITRDIHEREIKTIEKSKESNSK